MPRTGRPKADLTLTEAEREQLLGWSRRSKLAQSLALRSKIILRCADGLDNQTVAAQLSRRDGGQVAAPVSWRNGWTD